MTERATPDDKTYVDLCGSVAEIVASAPPPTPEAAEELRRLLPLGRRAPERVEVTEDTTA